MVSKAPLVDDRQVFIPGSHWKVFETISTPRRLASWMVVGSGSPAEASAKYGINEERRTQE